MVAKRRGDLTHGLTGKVPSEGTRATRVQASKTTGEEFVDARFDVRLPTLVSV